MRRHLFHLISIGMLAAASLAVSGCAEPDGYYGPEPEYEGPVYEAPPAVYYYDGPAYREHEHWRHEHEEHEHEDDD